MLHLQALLRAPARSGLDLTRVLAGLAAVAIGLAGAVMTPGILRANQTYPAALGAGSPVSASARLALAPGKHYLTRKAVEAIARNDIGKLQGLRIGPFAPDASSRALPLDRAEALIGHTLPTGADPAAPVWVVTVDAPPKDNVLGDRTKAKAFTDVIHAVSGTVIDSCAGCRSVR